ncbi:MAG: GTPase HflX [Candidatus Nanopelagicales bacterium]
MSDIGELESQERERLRRVQSLSTELQDITEVEYRQVRLERVVLIGVWASGSLSSAEASMQELARLAETAGCTVVDAVIQRRDSPDAATYIGSGKVQEIRHLVHSTDADTIICDGELSPAQLRRLETETKVKVVDRTWLILDIFARHAKSREGKNQVSLAQMEYMLPRLRGWGEALSRQAGGRAGGAGGGVGTRGPGETKLETDRRRIRQQISKLRNELKDLAKVRTTQRHHRMQTGISQVALVGYTNAGKSSLLNLITGAGVLVQDELFATLDPTVRQLHLPSGREVTMADTVGFVRHLPHQLVEAFKSTLEEVIQADVLVHVVDATSERIEDQIDAVREVLMEIRAPLDRELIVFNKADALTVDQRKRLEQNYPESVLISAKTGEGQDGLLNAIDERLPGQDFEIWALLPYGEEKLLERLRRHSNIVSIEYRDSGTLIHVKTDSQFAEVLHSYRIVKET